jgi:hypothetical protein
MNALHDRTAFVLGNATDSEIAATALRLAGYRVVNPWEIDAMGILSRVDRGETATRDLRASLDCELIVMVPNAEIAPAAVAIVAAAGERAAEIVMIERLIPSWRKQAVAILPQGSDEWEKAKDEDTAQ